jgi:hypothetical protein
MDMKQLTKYVMHTLLLPYSAFSSLSFVFFSDDFRVVLFCLFWLGEGWKGEEHWFDSMVCFSGFLFFWGGSPGIRKTISSSNQPPMLKTLKNQRASSESLLQRVQGDNESRALSLRCGEFTMELSLAPLTEDDPRFTTKSKKVLLVATLKKTVVDASTTTYQKIRSLRKQ